MQNGRSVECMGACENGCSDERMDGGVREWMEG